MMPSYSPLFGAYTLRTERSGLNRAYFRLGRRTRKVRELLDTTIGAAAGSAALLTHKRVSHNRGGNAGKVAIETATDLSRNSTAADVTALKGYFSTDSKIATPTNRAGSWDV